MEEEDYYDFESDTAECSFCGHYYCLCCGCDCLSEDIYEDYIEEEGTNAI